MTLTDRQLVLGLVAAAVEDGSRQAQACKTLGLNERTLQRWQRPESTTDSRQGPTAASQHSLTQSEREQVLKIASSSEFANKSPHQSFLRLQIAASMWHRSHLFIDC